MEQSLFGYYLLPEDAQLRLLQTRDHLRFLASLVCAKHSADASREPLNNAPQMRDTMGSE
ncbi:hypothetical protein XavaCFBP5823_22015 [Xanthomonas axonopodis pv. vasculorum]|nr:hypothetical protein XavaCFBP5823_22015 [Xanthomonas axonopodis pv. vasculorum]